jgi:MFS family permease
VFKRIKFPHLFFGWWINIVVSLVFSLVCGYCNQGASVIFKPLSAALSLNRAQTSTATGIGSLQNVITFPLAGWLCDKYGSRYLAIIGCCMTGIGFILMYFIQSAWQYYIVWGLLIAGGSTLGFSVSIDKVITNWFVKKRGLAFSIRFTIVAIVGMLLLPLISLLVTSWGWRPTALIWAFLAFASIPVALYFIPKHRPEYYGILPDGDKQPQVTPISDSNSVSSNGPSVTGFEDREFTLGQALKTPTYWLLTLIWTLYFAVIGGIAIHLIPMFTDTGITPVRAASLVALITLFSLPSRFFIGIFADRFSIFKLKFLLGGIMVLTAGGVWSLAFSEFFMPGIYIFLVLYGLGASAFVPLDIIIRSRYYGRKAYGSIQSMSVIFSAPISFLAPIYSGRVYDANNSYASAFMVFAILATCGAITAFFLKVPRLKNNTNMIK